MNHELMQGGVPMRRKDRLIADFDDILTIIKQCDVIRLGLYDGEETYVVPLNFGFSCDESGLRFYMHSARKGRKVRILAEHPNVSFTLDRGHELFRRGGYITMGFESVMGTGIIRFVESEEERREGLRLLMSHYFDDLSYDEKEYPAIDVLCLHVDKVSGKRLVPKPD